MTKEILAIAGSIRQKSTNRALLEATRELAPSSLSISLTAIDQLPHYNSDIDGDAAPASVKELKAAVTAADGLLIATPEYNYGIPGVLKNAIDWVSRPAYRSPLANKPVAMLGASLSSVGSARAQGQLKQVLLGTVSNVFPYPEVLVSGRTFDENLKLKDDATREAIKEMLQSYASWLGASEPAS